MKRRPSSLEPMTAEKARKLHYGTLLALYEAEVRSQIELSESAKILHAELLDRLGREEIMSKARGRFGAP